MTLVKIGSKSIPLLEGKTVAVFSAGRKGKREAGTYYFWSAVVLDKRTARKISGRALKHLDAGERFRRIGQESKTAKSAADRKHYAKHWKLLQSAVYVQPAQLAEVMNWLSTHMEDAIYLKSLRFV